MKDRRLPSARRAPGRSSSTRTGPASVGSATSPSTSGRTPTRRSSNSASARASSSTRSAPTASTIARGREAFGSLHLREIGNPELRRYMEPFEDLKPASDFATCERTGLPGGGGGGRLPRRERGPRLHQGREARKSPKRGKAPFEDVELERLWTELDSLDDKVYLYACRFSCETGARLGELLALEWPNVDLLNGCVRIEYQWDERAGLIEPRGRRLRRSPCPRCRGRVSAWLSCGSVPSSAGISPAAI